MFHVPAHKQPSKEKQVTIVVIAPNCWGSGKSLRSALGKASINYPTFKPRPMPYNAFRVEGEFSVDAFGTLEADKVELIRSVK